MPPRLTHTALHVATAFHPVVVVAKRAPDTVVPGKMGVVGGSAAATIETAMNTAPVTEAPIVVITATEEAAGRMTETTTATKTERAPE